VRCEGETEVFGKMDRIYGRGRHLEEIRKFGKYNGVSRRI